MITQSIQKCYVIYYNIQTEIFVVDKRLNYMYNVFQVGYISIQSVTISPHA